MVSTFKNQLTNQEIFKGLFVYLSKKLIFMFLIFVSIISLLSYSASKNISGSIIAGIFISIFVELLIILIIKQRFSPNKIATYFLNSDSLEIVNSDGKKSNFPYSQISGTVLKDMFILIFSKDSFSLVSQKYMTAQQIEELKKRIIF